MSKKYDAIICGAGPAGAITALCLRRKGFSVLLIDKQEFPRDKICGDQITPVGVQLLKELGLVDKNLLDHVTQIDKIRICGPKRSSVDLQLDLSADQSNIFVVPRKKLDNHLVKKIEEEKVSRKTCQVIGIQQNIDSVSVKTADEEFRGRILIGADGSASTISRLANLAPVKNRGIAIRAYLEGIDLQSDMLEGFFDDKWLPGYAWLFPTGLKSANIGLGMDVGHYRKANKNLHELLKIFIDQPYIKKRLQKDYRVNNIGTWPLNIGPPRWTEIYQDRLLLIGDAASLINPFTGGGIETGIISGKIAAEFVAEKLPGNKLSKGDLKEYSNRLKKELNLEQIVSSYMAKIVGFSPKMVERLIKVAGKSNLPLFFMKYVYKGIGLKRIS